MRKPPASELLTMIAFTAVLCWCLVLLVPRCALAQDTVSLAPALTTEAAAALDNPVASFSNFFAAVRDGQYWLAVMFALVFVVGLVRTAGKKIHALIPDDTQHPVLKPVEAVLAFIFDTKVGAWLLNWTTAISGCLLASYMAGAKVDGATWKTAILISTSATTLVELKADVMEWWEAKKKGAPPDPAATAPGGGAA